VSHDYKQNKQRTAVVSLTKTQKLQQRREKRQTKQIRNNKNIDKRPTVKAFHSYNDKEKTIKFQPLSYHFLTQIPPAAPLQIQPNELEQELKDSTITGCSLLTDPASAKRKFVSYFYTLENTFHDYYTFFPENNTPTKATQIETWLQNTTPQQLQAEKEKILQQAKDDELKYHVVYHSHLWKSNSRFKCSYDEYERRFKNVPSFCCTRCEINCCLFCVQSHNHINCIDPYNNDYESELIKKLQLLKLE
jgi:hypothetical protein